MKSENLIDNGECDIIGNTSLASVKQDLDVTTKEKISGIYKIINKVNGKYYVGSSKNIQKRLNTHLTHLNGNYHFNDHLQYAWNKYGKENFNFIIVELFGVNISSHELLLIEQKYLDIAINEQNECYNLRFIAGGGGNLSEYTRKKMSNSHKGKSMTLNNKLALIKANTGKIFSKEHREKIGIESKKRMSGRKLSEKHKEKLKISMIGKNVGKPGLKSNTNPMYNHNTYSFKNIKNNDLFIGTSYDFRIKYNLLASSISLLLNNKQRSVKKWILV
jgi:group I intron endonuclease